MADQIEKSGQNAEKAVVAAASVAAAPAKVQAPVAKKATAKPARKPVKKAAAATKKAAPAKKVTAKPAKKPAAKRAKKTVSTKTTPVTAMKDKTMANKTADFTDMMSKTMTNATADMQAKAQDAYKKGTNLVAEMNEVTKGNVEAIVESGQILTAGVKDMGKTFADEAKTVYEVMTADMKEMAAVKSPTDLFQLQSNILRRNFDVAVAASTKNGEAALKLVNDVAAPISGRVNVAVEKLSKVA